MKIPNLNLENKDGILQKNVSVDLTNLAQSATYFGVGFPDATTVDDVAEWCRKNIGIYKRLIQFLQTVLVKTRLKEGLNIDEFRTLVAILNQIYTVFIFVGATFWVAFFMPIYQMFQIILLPLQLETTICLIVLNSQNNLD